MSRLGQLILQYGLDLLDFEIDEDGDITLTDSGLEKLGISEDDDNWPWWLHP